MVTIGEPTFVRFVPGVQVEGVLLTIESLEVGDEKANQARYTVESLEDGELYSFLGTVQIKQKLRAGHVGHYVVVVMEGHDKTVSKGGKPMGVFTVRVSKGKVER
jgi:hypothetical protein